MVFFCFFFAKKSGLIFKSPVATLKRYDFKDRSSFVVFPVWVYVSMVVQLSAADWRVVIIRCVPVFVVQLYFLSANNESC